MNLKQTGKTFFVVGMVVVCAVISHYILRRQHPDLVSALACVAGVTAGLGALFLLGHAYCTTEEAKRDGYKFRMGATVQYIAEEDWQFKNNCGTINERFLDGNGEKWYAIEADNGSIFHVPEYYVMDTV